VKKIGYHIIHFSILLTIVISYSFGTTTISSIKFKHLSVKDGLSRSWVKCIHQDSHGFLWFGTEDGLNKYDGYNFSVYRHNSTYKNSLNHNNITTIYEDSKGTLWIGTHVGLYIYNRDTVEFIPINAILS
jgi:ligand-binding sensor domain-containing protein